MKHKKFFEKLKRNFQKGYFPRSKIEKSYVTHFSLLYPCVFFSTLEEIVRFVWWVLQVSLLWTCGWEHRILMDSSEIHQNLSKESVIPKTTPPRSVSSKFFLYSFQKAQYFIQQWTFFSFSIMKKSAHFNNMIQ